jgi:hypothetical protein
LIDDVTFTEENDLIEEAVDIRRRLQQDKLHISRKKPSLPEAMILNLSSQGYDSTPECFVGYRMLLPYPDHLKYNP